MKSKLAIPLLLASALLLPYAASGQTPAPDSTGTTGQAVPPESTDASQAQSATGTTVTTTDTTTTTTAQNSTMATDQSVAAKIKSEMAAQNVASLPDINVEADSGGGVTLSGTAQSQEDIDKTMSIARSTSGVTSVKNDIKVKPQG